MQQLRVYLGFPVGLERVLEEKENLLVPARGGGVKEPCHTCGEQYTWGKQKFLFLILSEKRLSLSSRCRRRLQALRLPSLADALSNINSHHLLDLSVRHGEEVPGQPSVELDYRHVIRRLVVTTQLVGAVNHPVVTAQKTLAPRPFL